jgi:hypothetical protein
MTWTGLIRIYRGPAGPNSESAEPRAVLGRNPLCSLGTLLAACASARSKGHFGGLGVCHQQDCRKATTLELLPDSPRRTRQDHPTAQFHDVGTTVDVPMG